MINHPVATTDPKDLHLLPGDILAGLLKGWAGPVDYYDNHGDQDAEPEWRPAIVNTLGMVWYEAEDCSWRPVESDHPKLRLNLLRPEALAHVSHFLAQGSRCPTCNPPGAHVREGLVPRVDPKDGRSTVWVACPTCSTDAGWPRKPTPVYHLTDAGRTGVLAPLVIAQAVGWSMRSVAQGGGVLQGVASEWTAVGRIRDLRTGMRQGVIAHVHMGGWRAYDEYGDLLGSGTATGIVGQATADGTLLSHRIALLEPGGATFPEIHNAT